MYLSYNLQIFWGFYAQTILFCSSLNLGFLLTFLVGSEICWQINSNNCWPSLHTIPTCCNIHSKLARKFELYNVNISFVVDIVCQNCPPCVGHCQSKNMVCNTKSRMCVCRDGYVLDPSLLSCSRVSGAVTNIRCIHQVDCTVYPGTFCAVDIGKLHFSFSTFGRTQIKLKFAKMGSR